MSRLDKTTLRTVSFAQMLRLKLISAALLLVLWVYASPAISTMIRNSVGPKQLQDNNVGYLNVVANERIELAGWIVLGVVLFLMFLPELKRLFTPEQVPQNNEEN